MNITDLEREYESLAPSAKQFGAEFSRQLDELIKQQSISLGFPLQQRVKEWASIAEKIERKSLDPKNIRDVLDLIGMRIIVLFQRDAKAVCELIKDNFKILQQENTQERLGASEFGYSSIHFLVELRPDWLAIPTFKKAGSFMAEIQVRTVAQHIWAATSHILQYKQEQGVPPPVRRAIYRVSALLETVDLEFERVLTERASYVDKAKTNSALEELNVDLLAKILDEQFPSENKDENEPYADLLPDLFQFSVRTPQQLRAILAKHHAAVMKEEKNTFAQRKTSGDLIGTSKARLDQGVFFAHVGLARRALASEFGKAWEEYGAKKWHNRRRRKRQVRKDVKSLNP